MVYKADARNSVSLKWYIMPSYESVCVFKGKICLFLESLGLPKENIGLLQRLIYNAVLVNKWLHLGSICLNKGLLDCYDDQFR